MVMSSEQTVWRNVPAMVASSPMVSLHPEVGSQKPEIPLVSRMQSNSLARAPTDTLPPSWLEP